MPLYCVARRSTQDPSGCAGSRGSTTLFTGDPERADRFGPGGPDAEFSNGTAQRYGLPSDVGAGCSVPGGGPACQMISQCVLCRCPVDVTIMDSSECNSNPGPRCHCRLRRVTRRKWGACTRTWRPQSATWSVAPGLSSRIAETTRSTRPPQAMSNGPTGLSTSLSLVFLSPFAARESPEGTPILAAKGNDMTCAILLHGGGAPVVRTGRRRWSSSCYAAHRVSPLICRIRPAGNLTSVEISFRHPFVVSPHDCQRASG